MSSASSAITAQNSFTSGISFLPQTVFNISVQGTFSATVTLQRSYDSGVTWYDVDTGSWTAATESGGWNADSGVLWRIGVKTGGFTSGTANVRIGQ